MPLWGTCGWILTAFGEYRIFPCRREVDMPFECYNVRNTASKTLIRGINTIMYSFRHLGVLVGSMGPINAAIGYTYCPILISRRG